MSALKRGRTALLAGLASAALLLTACATSAPAEQPAEAPEAAAGAPATPGLISEGTLTVGLVLPDAPYMIPDGDNVVVSGITHDLLVAVAGELGLDIEFVNVAWEGGVAGVAAGRYDIFGGSLYDTLERQEAGTFVDFMKEQSILITNGANAERYTDRLSACGSSLAAIRGTTHVVYAEELNAECAAAGKDSVEVTEYPTLQDAELALQSGRTDLGMQSEAAAAYDIANGADKAIVGEPFAGGFYVGSLMNSAKPELIEAVLWAQQQLFSSGRSAQILGEYGVAPVEPGVNLQK